MLIKSPPPQSPFPPVATRRSSESTAQPRPAIEAHLHKFFDRNGDRKISVRETYVGVRDLGIGRLAASAVALAINAGLGRTTHGGPLTVNLDNISMGKHGGDSGILDADGRFVQEKFDAVFERHAKTYADALTADEVKAFRKANFDQDPNRKPSDFVAGLGEFGLLFRVGAQRRDGQAVLTKERLFDFYHGDLLHTIAAEQKAIRAERSKTLAGATKNLVRDWIF